MTRFSTENQPVAEQRKRPCCRFGHSLEPGNPNVRIRPDGNRLCRVCESDRRATKRSYMIRLKLRFNTCDKFTIEGLSYPISIYEQATIPRLQEFYNWQAGMLAWAQAQKDGKSFTAKGGDGTPVSKEDIISELELDMPVVNKIVVRKGIEGLKEHDNGEALTKAKLLAIKDFIALRGYGKQIKVREIRSIFNRGYNQPQWEALLASMEADPDFIFFNSNKSKDSWTVTMHPPAEKGPESFADMLNKAVKESAEEKAQ